MTPCVALLVVTLLESASVWSSPTPTAGVIYAAAPEQRGAFHVGGKGVYNYGYNTGDGIAKVEVRHLDGSVTGSYRYYDPNGRQIVRSYIADNKGFRVLGNELPISPDTPALGIVDAQTLTAPVEGSRDFLGPNFVTNDGSTLLFQNQLGQHTIFTSEQNAKLSHIQTQTDFAQQQQELIRQQEEKLEQLKLQQKEFLRQQKDQIQQMRILQTKQTNQNPQTQQSIVDYSTIFNNLFGMDSPYFYSEDNINYDFPAGFAYNARPSYVPRPVGVKGEHARLVVAAGHSPEMILRPPTYDFSRPRRTDYQGKGYRHPYILGHAR